MPLVLVWIGQFCRDVINPTPTLTQHQHQHQHSNVNSTRKHFHSNRPTSSRTRFVIILTSIKSDFSVANYLMQWSSRCCVKGKHKASSMTGRPSICDKDDLDRRSMTTAVRIICRHAERICCVKEIQKLSCQLGKYHA